MTSFFNLTPHNNTQTPQTQKHKIHKHHRHQPFLAHTLHIACILPWAFLESWKTHTYSTLNGNLCKLFELIMFQLIIQFFSFSFFLFMMTWNLPRQGHLDPSLENKPRIHEPTRQKRVSSSLGELLVGIKPRMFGSKTLLKLPTTRLHLNRQWLIGELVKYMETWGIEPTPNYQLLNFLAILNQCKQITIYVSPSTGKPSLHSSCLPTNTNSHPILSLIDKRYSCLPAHMYTNALSSPPPLLPTSGSLSRRH